MTVRTVRQRLLRPYGHSLTLNQLRDRMESIEELIRLSASPRVAGERGLRPSASLAQRSEGAFRTPPSPNAFDFDAPPDSVRKPRIELAAAPSPTEELAQLSRELDKQLLRFASICRGTSQFIRRNTRDSRHRAILEAHYLGLAPWALVAEQTSYSERHVKRLHNQALQSIAERMSAEERREAKCVPGKNPPRCWASLKKSPTQICATICS